MRVFLLTVIVFIFFQGRSQVNLVANSSFELHTACPAFGAEWNYCNGWDNVNMNIGPGFWGTPDFFHTCGSGNTVPPATFAGTCNPHTGNGMMALGMYNVPYPNYREYIARQLLAPMLPGVTYTLSFWLSNGTGIRSPWTIRNIGANFSATPNIQAGYSVINVIPQCEITTNVMSTAWTQYTFTVQPTATWNYVTIGSFRNDASNNPTLSFPNPGGNPSVYAMYFLDDVEVLSPCNTTPISVTASAAGKCVGGPAVTLTATGGSTGYTWTPSASLSSSTGSVVSANPLVATTYTVRDIACSQSTVITVNAYPQPLVTATSNTPAVCPGGSVTLTAANAITFTWQPGNMQGGQIVVTPATTTQYMVTGTDGNGCTATTDVIATIASNPVFGVSPVSQTVCQGAPATFTTSTFFVTTYTWQPGNIQGPGPTVVPQATTVYSVTGSNAIGCVTTKTAAVYVVPTSSLVISPASQTVCPGTPVSYTVSGSASYTWQPGNLPGSVVSFTPATSSVYTVTGVSSVGCVPTATASVVVTPVPAISVSGSALQVICPGFSATYTASGALSYTWQPQNTQGPVVVAAPAATTLYTVTGTSNEGCTASVTRTLIVGATPTIAISPASQIVCEGVAGSFTASGAVAYTWSPGNATGSVVSLIPPASGIYTITGSSADNCINTATLPVTVVHNPTLAVSPVSQTVCPGTPASFTASGAINYTWQPGSLQGSVQTFTPLATTGYTVTGTANNGCTASATVEAVLPSTGLTVLPLTQTVCAGVGFSYAASGALSYTWQPGNIQTATANFTAGATTVYTLSGTSSNGCVFTRTVITVVSSNPTLVISPASPTACAGSVITLIASGANSYSWQPGNSNGAAFNFTATSSTVYTVSGTNANGCSSVATASIAVFLNPVLVLSAASQTACAGAAATLIVSGANTYNWLPGNGQSNAISISPQATTVYTVTGVGSQGCVSTATSIVAVFNPTIAVSPATQSVCAGVAVSFTASGLPSFTWQPGNIQGPVLSVTPGVSGSYTATAIDLNGCTATASHVVIVMPDPTIVLSQAEPLLCAGSAVSVTASGADVYTWQPGNIGGTTAVLSPASTTGYTITGTSGSGCTGSATLNITVQNCGTSFFGLANSAAKPVLQSGNVYKIDLMVTVVNNSTHGLAHIKLTDDFKTTFPAPCVYSVLNAPRLTSAGSSLTLNPFFDGNSNTDLTEPSSSAMAAGRHDTIVFSLLLEPKGFYGTVNNSVIGFADLPNGTVLIDISNDGVVCDPDGDGNPTNNNIPTPIDIEYLDFFIPQGFSPDGDGNNDLFVIKGLNGRDVRLTVFNRWGNKVYDKENYDNSWDGRANTSNVMIGRGTLPQSTYYYIVQFMDGKKETKTGFIVLQY